MANRYWVGGTGTWDSVTKTRWSTSSGGSGGATVPTSADDVFIDANSGSGSYTITNTGGSVDCKSLTISGLTTQSLTFTIQSGINCYGSWNTQGTQVTYTVPAGTVSIILQGTTSGLTFNPNGVSLPFNVTFSGSGSSYALGSNLTLTKSASVCNITAGTLNIGSYTVSLSRFSMSSGTTIVSSSGTINCNGSGIASGTALFNRSTATVSGALTIIYSSTASADTNYVLVSPTTSCNIKATSGSYTLNLSGDMNNVDLTGYTGNWPISGSVYRIDGNLTLGTGMTTSFGASGGLNMYQGTSNAVITSNGVTVNAPVSIGGGTSRIVQLADNLTINSSYLFTMFDCYFDLNSRTLSTGRFTTGNTSIAKTIVFGASGNITCTGFGNASTTPTYTFYAPEASNRLTLTGSKTVNLTYAGSSQSRIQSNASVSTPTKDTSFNINVSAGTGDLYWYASPFDNINFTGFSGRLYPNSPGTQLYVFGNITFSSSMTFRGGSFEVYFEAASGTQTITTNGVVIDGLQFIKSIDSTKTGSTLSLADNLNMTGISTQTITINAGTFDANNKNITAFGLYSTGSATRSVLLGNGTHSFYGTSPLTFTGTNLTFNSGTSQVNLTNTSNSTTITTVFSDVSSGGITPTAYSLNNLGLNGGSATGQTYYFGRSTSIAGTLSSNKTVAYTIQFAGYSNGNGVPFAYTHTFANWSISGSEGNLVTLTNDSFVETNYFKIIKSGGGAAQTDYIQVYRSVAEPAITWYAGKNSIANGLTGGWVFNRLPQFFSFF